MVSYRITGLNSRHDRAAFDCGEPALNDYLQRYSTQNQKQGLSTTHIMEQKDGGAIIGYFSLSVGSIQPEELPINETKRIPRYVDRPPILHLTRLAVDKHYRGQGMGGLLLTEALLMCHSVQDIAGFTAIIVDAKHDKAKAFYLHYGFIPTVDAELRLFMTKKQLGAFVRPLLQAAITPESP